MLVLALDTATPAVTAGVVDFDHEGLARTLATRVTIDARAHGELLTPHTKEALAEAGLDFADLDAVVCGSGPGPFTGLRAGMVTAAALGQALGKPVYPVSTLDALAADYAEVHRLLVVTDARRKEVYWARYENGHRVEGPDVCKPAGLEDVEVDLVVGAELLQRAVEPASPSPNGLVMAASPLFGRTPPPLTPLYLRRPDAVEPGARKRVSRA
ncbi:tRNA (adenosine(37)-N6)-threonylcarbamoyltransferase complex dimerization subunit type 1 TsaB [Kibdelosporangium persicum]|uniref:tRNA threonylcarbamoyl adenosine modification protein YeaZ n=1 Tax=Kibdelosporangium persicum TaxID=2698649 RepID=A0ABX2F081_9PSEU|nr:tRNA (adenosine(37)-N6)-threonylcarbamoyltransferase complex dimerization subunit type 1 TsaB [Kibdelosporangium persicum]NRN64559.1 tRNA threonylcarbamoyl adenosine modification protein YeaZ [Kibdelosporangium persicum]